MFTNYFLKVWLYSIEKPVVFQLSKEEWERFERNYRDNHSHFFICETLEGKYTAINLRQVQFAHLLWDVGEYKPTDNDNWEGISLYFLNREPTHFEVDVPIEIANIFFALEADHVDEKMSFTDIDGELLIFGPNNLLLLQADATMVKEGQEQILDELTK